MCAIERLYTEQKSRGYKPQCRSPSPILFTMIFPRSLIFLAPTREPSEPQRGPNLH
jgi:hypothetical protein